MAARRDYTPEQQSLLLEWLAADFPAAGIKRGFQERGWPAPTDAMLSYYRQRFAADLTAARADRLAAALTRGYATKEARIAALNAHAEALESIRWISDDKGRLWNEKAWRETLDDLAKETGGRAQKQEISGPDGSALTIHVVYADFEARP